MDTKFRRIQTYPVCIIRVLFVQILSFGSDDVFKLDVSLYNDATQGQRYHDVHAFDIEVSLQTGCMKVVFLNKFVQNLLVRIDICYVSTAPSPNCDIIESSVAKKTWIVPNKQKHPDWSECYGYCVCVCII